MYLSEKYLGLPKPASNLRDPKMGGARTPSDDLLPRPAAAAAAAAMGKTAARDRNKIKDIMVRVIAILFFAPNS
jgi:hypothetical protein